MKKTEERMLNYIKDYMKECGMTPNMREIAVEMGFRSTSTAHKHFERLVNEGYIEQYDKRYRVKGMRYVEE